MWKPSGRWRKRFAKRMSDFRWGQDFNRMRRIKKSEESKSGSRTEETVIDVNGWLLKGNE